MVYVRKGKPPKQPDVSVLGKRKDPVTGMGLGGKRVYRRGDPEFEAKRQEVYLAALPMYFTQTAALAKAGVKWDSLKRWREQDATFLIREQDARNELADKLEGEAIRRAFKGIKVPVYQGGLLAGHTIQYSDALLTLMLKAMRPEKFRDRSEVSVTQPIVKVVAGFDPAEVL